MKKIIIIVIAILVLAAIVGGAFWLGSRSKQTGSTNKAVNNNAETTNANLAKPNVTYEKFTGDNVSGYTFDTVREWTSVAPAEIQKSITAEQRNGYEIIYYATNLDVVILSVSEKRTSDSISSLASVVEDDIAIARNRQPNLSIADKSISASEARTEMRLQTASSDYTIYSRYLMLPAAGDGRSRWALMEVSVPTSRTNQYQDVVSHLLDSLKISSSS